MTEQRAVRRYTADENYSELIEDGAVWMRATDYDTLSTELAEAKAEIERMREALEHFAMLPLEEFGFDEKPDERPITGFNKWQLTVGHIRKARAALIPAKGKEKP